MHNQKESRNTDKFKIQDEQYKFPYHYIPYFDSDSNANRLQLIDNGFEYLCYVKHIISIIKSYDEQNILEVGCGDGRIINLLNRKDIVGVDLSEKGITLAKAFNPESRFVLGDASDLNETFSIVFAVEVLEHIPEKIIPQFWKTLYDRCKLNGKIIISVPSVNKEMINKHFRHYDLNLIKQEIESAGLSDKIEIQNVEYIYKETYAIKLWKRFTNNKYWTFELHYLRKKMWNYIWHKIRIADKDTGYHLIIVLNKIL